MSGPGIFREEQEWSRIQVETPDEHSLPRILLIGDSITQGCFPEVVKGLRGKAACVAYCTSRFPLDPVFLQELGSRAEPVCLRVDSDEQRTARLDVQRG